jgi:radical SAM superfamily enzyme YgiQ (UPF0313 family)
MDAKVLLNWMPPASIAIPSPAMSVLKKYLESKGYDVDVYYWNFSLFKLQSKFIWDQEINSDDLTGLYIFYNYLCAKEPNSEAKKQLRIYLRLLKPQYINISYDFYDLHMLEYNQKLNSFLDTKLQELELSKYLLCGLSVNLYQWVCSSIIAEKIKLIHPQLPIVIGGIGTKDSAIAFLNNFPQFDISLWGEGEDNLHSVCEAISLNSTIPIYDGIANIAYKKEGEIITNNKSTKHYIDLFSESIRPDFSDYFKQKEKENIPVKTYIPIENSRSCHWRKCHFCYLNNGYKYRLKPVDTVLSEIREMLSAYNINDFGFLDNDLIGLDVNRFEYLLNSLIELRGEFPDFQIIVAEIITKDIHHSILIKKMAIAGFKHVQIGYESASNELLKKINKKNTFASNLFFIKFASLYHINIGGANVLRNLLEETDDDIFEAIENLHYMRFYINNATFKHNISKLGVVYSSRYYKEIEDEIDDWTDNLMATLLPENYLKQENRIKIIEVFKPQTNRLWDLFAELEKYYLKHQYYHQLLDKTNINNTIIYREYYNSEMINELEIEVDSVHHFILQQANDKVTSLMDLINISKSQGHLFQETEITNALIDLNHEGLLYYSKNMEEIISIINILIL